MTAVHIEFDHRDRWSKLPDDHQANLIRFTEISNSARDSCYAYLAGLGLCFALPFYLTTQYGFNRVVVPSLVSAAMAPVAGVLALKSAKEHQKYDRLVFETEFHVNRLLEQEKEADLVGHGRHVVAAVESDFPSQESQSGQQVQQVIVGRPREEWSQEASIIEAIFREYGKPFTIKDKIYTGDRVEYELKIGKGVKITEIKTTPEITDYLLYAGFEDPKIQIQKGRLVFSIKNPDMPQVQARTQLNLQQREKEPIAAQPAQPPEQQQPPRFVEDGPSFTIVPPSPQQQAPVYSPVQQQPQGDHLRVMLGYGRNDGISRCWDLSQQANGFFLGLGASGSGKTETLKVLAIEVKHYGIPVLITDFHGDIEIGEFKTITLSHSPQLPYGVNPLELDSIDPRDGGVYAQIQIVLEMLKTCVSGMGHQQYRIIKQALETVYAQRGIKDSDPKTFTLAAPTFGEVLDVLELMVSDEETTSQQRNTAASAIAVVSKVFEHPIFSKPKQLSPRELSQGWYRLNMKHLEEHIKYVVAETLLRKASRYLRSQGHIAVQPQSDRDRFRWFFMVDEAKVLSMGGANKDNANAPLNKAATEDRKFGLGMALFSQITDHFSKELLAQFAARLVMKPFDADEAKANAATIGVKPEDLMQLEGKGDGYLKLGNGNPADRISVLPTFKRPGYQPYIEQEEELVEEDPYEVFDEVFEDKHGFDPDEVLNPEPENTPDPWDEKPTANNPFDMVIDWIKANHPDRITDRNFPSDEKLSEFLIQWFRQQGQEIPQPSKASLLDFRNVINAKRGV